MFPLLPIFVPLGINRRQRRWPYVTWGLIAANVLVYVYALALGPANYHNLTLRYGFIPDHPTFVSLFSCQFLHAGGLHLLGNMVFLLVFGACVEDALGPALFLLFYLIGGLSADYLHAAMAQLSGISTGQACIGASGAVAALMGLSAIRFRKYDVRLWYLLVVFFLIVPRIYTGVFRLRCWLATGIWALLELGPAVSSIFSRWGDPVAHWAHLGGFGLGLAVSLVFGFAREGADEHVLEEAERAPLTNFPEIARLVETDPGNAAGWLLYARSRTKSGHHEEAREAYIKALEIFAAERKTAEVAQVYAELNQRLNPFGINRETFMQVGVLTDEGGFPELALHAYTCAARLDRQAPEAATAMLKAGRLSLERGDYEQAATWFRAFLKYHSGSEWVEMIKGMLADAESRLAETAPTRARRVAVPPPPVG